MYGEGEQGQTGRELNMHDLDGMDRSHREGGRLLVLVMELVETLVQPRSVVQSVQYVSSVVL